MTAITDRRHDAIVTNPTDNLGEGDRVWLASRPEYGGSFRVVQLQRRLRIGYAEPFTVKTVLFVDASRLCEPGCGCIVVGNPVACGQVSQ